MYNHIYMKMAIDIADRAKGKTSPNPNVGAIIVKDNEVIGSGFTQPFGSDHAEVQALKNCSKDPKNADLYVTLEPCSHHGATPPCVESIINACIKNVYAGIKDPNPKVNGKGFELLSNAGINTEFSFFTDIIEKQLEVYLYWIKNKRPFVILKNAVSLDAKIAAENGESKWITNKAARKKVHLLRSEVDAVLTTINTVINDDPLLNVRLEKNQDHISLNQVELVQRLNTKKLNYNDPIRIILDPKLQISLTSNIIKTIDKYNTIIFYDEKIDTKNSILCDLNITLIPVTCQNYALNFNEILTYLASRQITSIMVEAGQTLNSFLLKNNYINKLYYFIAPSIIGGNKNVYSELGITNFDSQIKLFDVDIEVIEDNVLVTGYIAKC